MEVKFKEEYMLTNRDIYEELENIELARKTLKSDYEKTVLKAFVLILKLLHNMITNQTTIMKAQGIKLVDSDKTIKPAIEEKSTK